MNLYFLDLVTSSKPGRREIFEVDLNEMMEEEIMSKVDGKKEYKMSPFSFSFDNQEFVIDIWKEGNIWINVSLDFNERLYLSPSLKTSLNKSKTSLLHSFGSFLKKRNISKINLILRMIIIISS
jgi:hypothetical protein